MFRRGYRATPSWSERSMAPGEPPNASSIGTPTRSPAYHQAGAGRNDPRSANTTVPELLAHGVSHKFYAETGGLQMWHFRCRACKVGLTQAEQDGEHSAPTQKLT